MFDGQDPVYVQIADYVRHQILTGVYSSGEQLMPTTQFATSYQVNPATVARAYTILEGESLVVKRRGMGVFVADDAASVLRETKRAEFFESKLKPLLEEAHQLSYTTKEVVAYVKQEFPQN